MSSSQQPPDVDADAEPIDRIKGFLARQTEEYLGGPLSPKEQLEERIRGRNEYGDLGIDTLDMYREELLPDVEAELDEGDGRTRGLSDVLPPGEWPRGDVYQYVPRRDLREYKYECDNHVERISPDWSWKEHRHLYKANWVGWGTTSAMGGETDPDSCPSCGGVLWTDGDVMECEHCIYYVEPCGWGTKRRCRGLPATCGKCGSWVRPEDDK